MGFGPIAWKEATGTYKSSRGKDEKSYYYRYAVLPLKPLPAKERKTVGIHPAKDDETANHIRISEKDWNRMKNTNDLVQFE
jgi:hypothetical protein